MTTALASLLSGRPVKHTVGMTGEVTLQGRVLPIGGLKQKVLAAHAAGLTDVILPERNRGDLDDVPADVREQMTFHPVMTVGEVLDIALEPTRHKGLSDAAWRHDLSRSGGPPCLVADPIGNDPRAGAGEKLEPAPRVRAPVRIKVQLPSSSALRALVARGARRRRRVHGAVRATARRQPPAAGGCSPSGPNTALSENCAASGGSMAAVLVGNQAPAASNAGWQVYAPANTTIAGATLYRKLAVAGTGYGYVARGITPAAANYQVFETCAGPAGCKQEIARGSFAWRSAARRRQPHPGLRAVRRAGGPEARGGEAAAVRITRADIALTDNAAPTISAGPTSTMFGSGAPR